MALSVNNASAGPPDSIIATCTIPPHLTLCDGKDLKDAFLGHFAHYGKILRISCTTKSKAKQVHLQFSSAVEASNAKTNGSSFSCLNFKIVLTNKHPNTQLLTSTPTPQKPPSWLVGIPSAPTVRQPSQTRTIDEYYQSANSQNTPPPNRSCAVSHSQRVDVPRVNPPEPPAAPDNFVEQLCDSIAASLKPEHKPPIPVPTTSSGGINEVKPNTCVKIEVYQGPPTPSPGASLSHTTNSRLSSESFGQVQTCAQTRVIRPSRTLSEILNVDITGLKLVPRVQASDALACQHFYGRSYSFPLAQMFGRSLGTVIMPTRSIMDAIKPGMKIENSTLEMVWNWIEGNVIKGFVRKCAKDVLLKETLLKTMTPEWMDQIEEDVIKGIVQKSARKQCAMEELVMMLSEDAMFDLCGDVSQNMIESFASSQLELLKQVTDSTEEFYPGLEKDTISTVLKKIAFDQFLNILCEEVIDDLIECPYLQGHVRIIGRKAIRKCRWERDSPLRSIPSSDSSTAVQQWVDEIPSSNPLSRVPSNFSGTLPADTRYASNTSISSSVGTSQRDMRRMDSPGLFGSLKRKLSFSNLFSVFKRRRSDED